MKFNLPRFIAMPLLKILKVLVTRLVMSNLVTAILINVLQHMSRDMSISITQHEKKLWLGFLYYMKVQSFSQISQDIWVLYRTTSRTNGFFVEVGSCHPTYLNNTFLLESTYNWSGILIEPNPHMAELLRAKRKSQVIEQAVADGDTIQLHLAENPEFSSTNFQLSKEAHKLHVPTGEVVLVNCGTLTDLLSKGGCPQSFQFLSLDIEGGELFALKSLDFNKFRPLLISVEHNFNSSRKLIAQHLIKNGYILDPLNAKGSWDDWYIDKVYFESLTNTTL
jgi:FkbM family methyltransferase